VSRDGPCSPVTASREYRREVSSAPADTLWIVFDAIASVIGRARRDVAAWLKTLHWPTDATHDIVLAIYEALANVVDHAYRDDDGPGERPGQLYVWQILDATTQQRRVVASVIDYGRWKQPTTPAEPAVAAGEPSARGRGLAMMSACMQYVDVQPSAGGTTVILTSHHAPAAITPHSKTPAPS
jgi:serine/threonine-protein kinase RsbW